MLNNIILHLIKIVREDVNHIIPNILTHTHNDDYDSYYSPTLDNACNKNKRISLEKSF